MYRPVFSLLVFFSFVVCGLAELTPEQRRADLESFDKVWNTVQDNHIAMNGKDWNAVRAELRPRIENAQTEAEVRRIMNEMLERLHQSHFGVIPRGLYQDVMSSDSLGISGGASGQAENVGTPGMDVRVLNGEVLVIRVEKGSAAAAAGVKAGWILDGIDGESIAPVLKRVSDAYAKSSMRQMMLAQSVLSRLEGPAGNPVDLDFRNGRGKKVALTVMREPTQGSATRFGYLPEEHLQFEAYRVRPDIEYIRFNLFLDPSELVPRFERAVRECAQCAGIVIDVRGNPGGIGLLASGLAGYFVSQPDEKLGTMNLRGLPLKFVVNPRPPVYEGRLAILIDGLSASTSEIFAGGLQDLKRARIFGTRSAGAALPSIIERLPNGDGFQYAAATYKSESGKVLEANGVTPDEEAPWSRSALLSEHDLALDAAVSWIYSSKSDAVLKGITTQ